MTDVCVLVLVFVCVCVFVLVFVCVVGGRVCCGLVGSESTLVLISEVDTNRYFSNGTIPKCRVD